MENYVRNMVIHCPKKIMALFLLRRMHEQGIKWSENLSLIRKDYWDEYRNQQSYRVGVGNSLNYASRDWYLNEGYEVTDFSELFPGKYGYRSEDIVSSLPNIPTLFVSEYLKIPVCDISKFWGATEWDMIVDIYKAWMESNVRAVEILEMNELL